MLLTDSFVFVHIPKTGGSFVRELCQQHMPQRLVESGLRHHAADRLIPDGFRHLPRFAVVRNPWDWYVSWFFYQRRRWEKVRREAAPDLVRLSLWSRITEDGRLDFGEALPRLLSGEGLEGDSDEVSRRRTQMVGEAGVGLFHIIMRAKVGESLDRGLITIGKLESLREAFLTFLTSSSIDVPDELLADLRVHPPVNVSSRGGYADYYDAPLAALVAQRERYLIDLFDYSFEPSGEAEAGGAA